MFVIWTKTTFCSHAVRNVMQSAKTTSRTRNNFTPKMGGPKMDYLLHMNKVRTIIKCVSGIGQVAGPNVEPGHSVGTTESALM